MNKDALLATIIGFAVGLVIAAAFFFGPALLSNTFHLNVPSISSLLSKLKRQQTTVVPTPTADDTTLHIQSPLDESIEPNQETLVSGVTLPNALVVIEGQGDDVVVTANNKGAFAGKITLTEGVNPIQVTSYADKTAQIQRITVYYTTEEF